MYYERILKNVILHIIFFVIIIMFANLIMYIDSFSSEYYTNFWNYIPLVVYLLFGLSFILSLFLTYKKSSN